MSDQSERRMRARIAANERWARTEDRAAATAAARQAFSDSFEALVDPDGRLDPAERARRAAYARKAHMTRLSLRAAQKRRREADGRDDAGLPALVPGMGPRLT